MISHMSTYKIKKSDTPVPITGNPKIPPWTEAASINLVDCVTGNPTRLNTQVRLLYDEEYLYAGYMVEDENIIASYTERDAPLYEEDVVELFLSPSGSMHYYYEFNFSPHGVIMDSIVLNNDGSMANGRGTLIPFSEWDCGDLQIASKITDNSDWSVTVAIPFRELHLANNRTPVKGETWRANICRIEYGLDPTEYSVWSRTGRVDFHTTEAFGTLIFD